MDIRQPTEKEMIQGIALGFKEFLVERDWVFGSDLRNHKIWEAIKIGVRDAFSGEDLSRYTTESIASQKPVDKKVLHTQAIKYDNGIKGSRDKVPIDVLEQVKFIASNFHYRNGVESYDGSVGSIKITYLELLDCLAYAFIQG